MDLHGNEAGNWEALLASFERLAARERRLVERVRKATGWQHLTEYRKNWKENPEDVLRDAPASIRGGGPA